MFLIKCRLGLQYTWHVFGKYRKSTESLVENEGTVPAASYTLVFFFSKIFLRPLSLQSQVEAQSPWRHTVHLCVTLRTTQYQSMGLQCKLHFLKEIFYVHCRASSPMWIKAQPQGMHTYVSLSCSNLPLQLSLRRLSKVSCKAEHSTVVPKTKTHMLHISLPLILNFFVLFCNWKLSWAETRSQLPLSHSYVCLPPSNVFQQICPILHC